jgi:homoserine dehydrogenase
MSYSKKIKIGLIGYGTVGKGFYKIFKESELYGKNNAQIKVYDIDLSKTEYLPISEIATSENAVMDYDLDILVELIDNADESFRLAKKAIAQGIPFITANKKMLAENIQQVSEWIKDGKIYYEASVAGSIPIIKTIREHYKDQRLQSIRGILNGSCNYVLTSIEKEGIGFEEALKKAQENGFAESDPTLDISGLDTLYKAVILASTAFGESVSLKEANLKGISNTDYIKPKEGTSVKLIADIERSEKGTINIDIKPVQISENDILSAIDYEYNCVEIINSNFGRQVLIGKGAGSLPTGSAVFADLANAATGILERQSRQENVLSFH